MAVIIVDSYYYGNFPPAGRPVAWAAPGLGTGRTMAHTLIVVVAVVAGALVDLGGYRLMVYSRRPAIRSSPLRRVTLRLPILLVLWIGVPAGEYYACSRAAASDGYFAATMFFIAGFILIGIFGNRNKYLSGLRKLEQEDDPAPDAVDGNQ